MTVGRPIVQSCMKGSGGMGNFEACREKARPAVVACMKSALNAANGRANVAVAIPTEAAPKASAAGAVPAADTRNSMRRLAASAAAPRPATLGWVDP